MKVSTGRWDIEKSGGEEKLMKSGLQGEEEEEQDISNESEKFDRLMDEMWS